MPTAPLSEQATSPAAGAPRRRGVVPEIAGKGLAIVLPLAAALMVGAATGPDTTITINVVSWGGAYEKSQRKAYFEPFAAANPGIKFNIINSGGEQVKVLREQAKAGAVTWDLVDVTAADSIRLCTDGIALPFKHDAILDKAPDGTGPREDFGQTLISDCFIPEIVYSTTVGYRRDLLREEPKSLCDLFDLARFPGKRALERRPINNLEWALVCDGVPPENVYEVLETEEGLIRAFHRLDQIKSQVVWWGEGTETPQLLTAGKVVMGSAYNGRLFDIVTAKKSKVKMLWDRQIFDFDGWIIPKGGRNIAAVLKFIRFATSTERLAAQASFIPYGPARRSSTSLVGKHATLGIDMRPHLPTAPENAKTTLIYNYDWWAEHRDALDKRFADWLAKQ